jgi:hypothetical protein
MLAMPEALVKPVPFEGLSVAKAVLVIANVTTALLTGAPEASRTWALAVAGVLVVVAPVVGSTRDITILGEAVAPELVPAPVPVPVVVASPLPPQLANRAVNATNIKAVSVLVCFEYMVLIQTPM